MSISSTVSTGTNRRVRTHHATASTTTTNGTASSIQPTNDTASSRADSAPSAIALGGLPTGVPIPPMFAATGMDRATPVRAGPGGRDAITGTTTANIVAVVAVLDTNIDSDAVITIRPSTAARGPRANGRSSTAARLRSRSNLAAPSAMRKPPRKSTITGSASVEK